MRDLLTPGYFLPHGANRRQSRHHLAAAIRLSALLREELLITDRMIMESGDIFGLLREDPELLALVKSEVFQVASFEHEMGTDRNLNLSETAVLMGKMRFSSNPQVFERRLHNPKFTELLSELDVAKKCVNSPVNDRDRWFTQIVENVLSEERGLIRTIFNQTFRPKLSDSDYVKIQIELENVFDELKAISADQNVDNAAILGIVDFLPEGHPHAAGRTDNFFVLAKRHSSTPLLCMRLADPGQVRLINEWINASYIAAEATSFSRNAVLCQEITPFESVVAGQSILDGDNIEPEEVTELAVDSCFFTTGNINSLTADDIHLLRESEDGKRFFSVFQAKMSNERYKDVLEHYPVRISEAVAAKTSLRHKDLIGKVSLELIQNLDQILLKLKTRIRESGDLKDAMGLVPGKVPFQLIVNLTQRTLAKAGDALSKQLGEDLIGGTIASSREFSESYLRLK